MIGHSKQQQKIKAIDVLEDNFEEEEIIESDSYIPVRNG